MKTVIFLVALLALPACKKKDATAEAEGSQSTTAYGERQAKLTYHRIENACVVVFADYSKEGFLAMTAVPCP